MKLVMDERVKHRLIGLAVILSIGAIFAPAVMKKSSQRIDGNTSITIKLPHKPSQPEIDMVEQKALFNGSQVAQVEQSNQREKELPLPNTTQEEFLNPTKEFQSSQVELVGQALVLADEKELDTQNHASREGPEAEVAQKVATGIRFRPAPIAKPKIVAKNLNLSKQTAKLKPTKFVKSVANKSYSIQLATFTQLQNANLLVSKLKTKGYKATVAKVKSNEGMLYKVLVGQVTKREQALMLQTQIAHAMQIKGFIVTTGEV